jgi:asparagine synthase (glutamine-hydrolysing)
VSEALLCGAIFEDRTLFAAVKALPPGSTLTAGPSGCRTAAYWSVPHAGNEEAATSAAANVSRLSEVLQDAIRIRIDDTLNWGVLLSGGTDSSALTAWSQHLSHAPVQTFSIDFPSAWRGDDDTRYAALVAEALGTRHRAFEAEAEEYFSALETLAWHVERPYNKAAATMYLLAARAAPHARFVLSGEGMDEMLAGYVGARGLGLDDRTDAMGPIHYFPWAPYAESMCHLLSDEFREAHHIHDLVEARLHDALAAAPGADALNRMLHLYTTHFLRELLALHEQGSLAAGVETRFPFLDRRVIELLAPLPSSLKFEHGQTKVVLREAIKDLVPREVLERRKTHLPMPRDPRAVTRQLGLARELLGHSGTRTARYFDSGRLARFLDVRAGVVDMLTVWQISMNLITLELVYRQFHL